jgi:transcriptional regulator with XRE-family HTH domain
LRSDVVAEQIVRLRKAAGLSREELAEKCRQRGWEGLTAAALANIETGRRDKSGRRRREITVDEKNVLAAALGKPPALLEVPLGSAERVEVLPGSLVDAWTAYRWLIGEFPTEALAVQQDPTVNYFRSDQAGETVNLYRQHHSALHGYLLHRAQNPHVAPNHLNVLAGTRIEMHRGGLWLPPVPDDVRDALREPLLAWGYREDPVGQLVKVGPSGSVPGHLGKVGAP